MKLTKDQVKHIAKLARIRLTEAEIAKFQTQLSGILDYVEQLNEINTDNIQPTSQVTGLNSVAREDNLRDNLLADPKALIECSPLQTERNQIKVRNVF